MQPWRHGAVGREALRLERTDIPGAAGRASGSVHAEGQRSEVVNSQFGKVETIAFADRIQKLEVGLLGSRSGDDGRIDRIGRSRVGSTDADG